MTATGSGTPLRPRLEVSGATFTVVTDTYRVAGHVERHRLDVDGPTGDRLTSLCLVASVDRVDLRDQALARESLRVDEQDDSVVISAGTSGGAWSGHVVEVTCRHDEIRLRTRIEGTGRIADVMLGGGRALLSSGSGGTFRSGISFDTLYVPTPTEPVAPTRPSTSAAQLSVVGDAEPGRLNGLYSPPPLVFALGDEGTDRWMGLSLIEDVARLGFTTMTYEPLDGGFLVRLAYEGHTVVDGSWTSPDLVIRPTSSGVAAIDDHRAELVERGWAGSARPVAPWANEPMFCGWGAQCAAAVRAGGDAPASKYATQANYDRWLSMLDHAGIRPGTVVIDDRWQAEYGANLADASAWPDLRAWVDRRHEQGRRVLLWLKAWDPTGVDPRLCVTTPSGRPVAVDPGNPDYLDLLDAQIAHLVSPDGYDVDGFKVDFTQRAPSGEALVAHTDGSDEAVWGIAALHRLLGTIHAAAHRVKPDALVITHAASPQFGDVTDMIRLNDVTVADPVGRAVPVEHQMRFRAEIARHALPGWPIDTDQWPMQSRADWLTYAREQVEHGVPALYYVESIDNSDETIEPDDLAEIAELWSGYRRERAR